MKKRVGFIGLGIMGKPMAKNLLKAGFPLVVFNRSKGAVEDLAGSGAAPAGSPREVAEKSDVIITMLPDSPEVEEVVLGPNGVVHGARSGSTLIDMSSINPLVSIKIAGVLKGKGVKMLDAPVSGGDIGAIQGTLAIMVGGESRVFEECLEILKTMGRNIVRVGEIGSGGFTKLVNQIICAIHIAALGEAFTFGAKAGLDLRVVHQAIRGGLAGSNMLEAKAPMMFERNFKPGFKVKLHQKDLQNALSTARDLGVPLPLSSLLQQVFISLGNEGRGEEDNLALVTFFEKLARVEIRSENPKKEG